MKANAYLDLETVGAADSGLSPPLMRSRLLSILHGVFEQQPGRFAIALTHNLGTLRLFASARSDFDRLVEAISPHPWIRDYARIGYPREVPGDYAGPWIAFRRYRIPTVKSDRNATDGVSALRDRRIDEAQTKRMQHFRLRSRSNSQTFTLTVEQVPCKTGGLDFTPDGYGLSTTTNTFGLPKLP
jgi:hypothetical protein